jgi:flagellar basal-body rod protein FlgC
MSLFSAMNISGSGMTTFRTWIDVLANNVANINTVRPTSGAAFQASYVQAQARPMGADASGGGVQPIELKQGSAEGRLTYQPESPLADAQGMVRLPDIDMSEQMTNMIMAQRAFQANAAVVDRARQSYMDAINIGKGR